MSQPLQDLMDGAATNLGDAKHAVSPVTGSVIDARRLSQWLADSEWLPGGSKPESVRAKSLSAVCLCSKEKNETERFGSKTHRRRGGVDRRVGQAKPVCSIVCAKFVTDSRPYISVLKVRGSRHGREIWQTQLNLCGEQLKIIDFSPFRTC
ncbi:hypothetical protein RRG08_036594 [Elysia crispata]|uniref:Uncharacterized protein n=1 Tax=Elysia crispata TaxID=231223 RepID=A0AAE0ZQU2_9GAST|nr:hypothetical protein RRG08_036594 [Elysia crispata]